MRITRLQLDDRAHEPLLEAASVSDSLNIVPLTDDNHGGAILDLLQVVLYGHGGLARKPKFDGAFGEVDLTADAGRFRLRRRHQADDTERLTVARLDGGPTPPRAIEQLLSQLPVGVVERVFHANGRRGDQLSELLSEEVAEVFLDLDRGRPAPSTQSTNALATGRADRVAQLRRRDELALAIEDLLGSRRLRSTEVETELHELEAEAQHLLERRESVDRRRMSVEGELSALETRLRYLAISETVQREQNQTDPESTGHQLDELEGQIDRWRQTLAELELRESHVRSELAAIHPDDASPSIVLSDQRAGLAVAQRLMHDLEGEVARLARAADSQACVCRDAHPRINPLLETLAKQIDRLTDLTAQQQLAFRAQQLKTESEHLARSQMDLQRQLDHLLTRRQELYRASRLKRTDGLDVVPAEGCCPRTRTELEAELSSVQAELNSLNESLERVSRKRRELDEQRGRLLSGSQLESLQRELAEVERQLTFTESPQPTAAPAANRWRASELFARLTDGKWVGLRLVLNGRELAATDHRGQQCLARELDASERRLASLALRLSMVWTAGQRGVRLPLILDEPFAGLTRDQIASLATTLEDYARAGRQLFVGTAEQDALSRFTSLGVHWLSYAAPARREYVVEQAPAPAPRAVTPDLPLQRVTTTKRVESTEYLLSPEDNIERFPVPIRNRETVFLRSRIRTIADLLGADPSAVAEELDRDDVTAELVALWQTHLGFVCFVPHLSFDDAVVLTGAGYYCPDDLADADDTDLHERASAYLASDRGQRLTDRGYRFDSERAGRWTSDARRGRDRWRNSSAWSGWQRHRGERRQRTSRNGWYERNGSRRNGTDGSHLRLRTDSSHDQSPSLSSRRNGSSSSSESSSTRTNGSSSRNGSSKSTTKQLKFYLETSSPIVDAPSIGPKTATKLEKAGVRTVADLIAADPELLAEKLDSSRIDAETLVAWQHQAQLVCRIPQLRGHDAQILVECGFTRPEEVASMKPAELFGFVEPFCGTAEAERIIRGGKAPDLAEVTDWINWSRQCRVLGAA
ncbi:hypothetical protein Pla123a_41840 [Posidoniimonas polymericola]|uniref:DUF4332 domain-containing protein n=1 Tax=Posidoniimonas polymericola TaxID=2528002 RepID=A0A5C5XY61_9BACT|nr:DUF4332 domain-containing protein [Posidoniimonas polymericola]TWT67628.1 hypothetical protein Pla123a_41840 [Posidoniimonas polymericola]